MTPARQHAILATTLQLVREVGYAAMTMDLIAERCDSSKATLYRFWPGKAVLVADSLRQALPEVSPELDTGSVRGDLLRMLRHPETEPEFDPQMIAAIVKMGADDPEVHASLVTEITGHFAQLLHEILDRARARGEHDLSAEDEQFISSLVMAYIIGYQPTFGRRLSEADMIQLVDKMVLPLLAAHDRSSSAAGPAGATG